MVRKIFLSLVSLSLTLGLLYITISGLLKYNLQEEQFLNYLKDNDISFLLRTQSGEESSFYKDLTAGLSQIQIPEETIIPILNSEPTKEFLATYIYNAVLSYIYDYEQPKVTSEEILSLLESNFPVIEQTLGEELAEAKQSEILNYANIYMEDLQGALPTINEVIQKVGLTSLENLKILIRIMQNKTIFILVSLGSLLFLGLLILFTRVAKTDEHYIKRSITLYVAILLVVEVLIGTILKDYFMSEIAIIKVFINYLCNILAKEIWLFVFLGLGITLLINLKNKRRKKI